MHRTTFGVALSADCTHTVIVAANTVCSADRICVTLCCFVRRNVIVLSVEYHRIRAVLCTSTTLIAPIIYVLSYGLKLFSMK